MADRHLPPQPEFDQLRRQAKELLRGARRGDPAASSRIARFHPRALDPARVKLADAQLALARSYGQPSWPRLKLACRLIEAIRRDDADAARDLVLAHPDLLDANLLGASSNWGPPMSYAANLGRDRIVALLRDLGARDLDPALDRACVRGQLGTARRLFEMGARPGPEALLGPAESHSAAGLELVLELGAGVSDGPAALLAAAAMVLQTYSRNPPGKHRCLELLAERGVELPDTPPMAVHRGRIDLLARHLQGDPDLARRTFSHREIYPPELGCDADESLALHGTPLAGAALLHLCVDGDELELAGWLLERGADANLAAAIDADGFGGHTPIFGCVVSQSYRVGRRLDDGFARMLLERGAAIDVRASLRKRLRFVADETTHEYRQVTPHEWGLRFHDQDWVSPAVMRLVGGG